MSDTTSETVEYEIRVNGSLLRTVMIEFGRRTVDAGKSEVFSSRYIVLANDQDSAVITVTLKDRMGVPMGGGHKVELYRHDNPDTPVDEAVTNVDGRAVFTVTNHLLGFFTYTPKVGGVALNSVPIEFVKGTEVDPAKSEVLFPGAPVPADGQTAAEIGVLLKESGGHPLGGRRVTLKVLDGQSVLQGRIGGRGCERPGAVCADQYQGGKRHLQGDGGRR